MQRILIISGLVLTLLLLAVGVAVNLRVTTGEAPLPAPDPSLPITLRDGSELPLSEVLARLKREELLPQVPVADIGVDQLPQLTAEEPAAGAQPAAPSALTPEELRQPQVDLNAAVRAEFGSVFLLAEEQRHKGHLDQAEALYLSIKEDEPGYAFSRRRLGWEVLAKGRDQPERAIPYVQEALRADPMNGNSWQDAARVYARTLGFDTD